LLLLSFSLSCAWLTRADFVPIALTTNSYNQDIVVERNAPPPAVRVTTASMDEGVSNSGYAWYERGYLTEWPSTGLPEAGAILTSDLLADHQYQMPPSYQTRNAFLIDTVRANARLTFTSPTNYAALSFLTSSGTARNLIKYTVRYQNGSSESGTFTSPNWYSDGDPAWAANGRINIASFAHADLNSYNPRLYSADVELLNTVSPVISVELSLTAGSGHTAVFAASGAFSLGDVFVPIDLSGYNEDLVVEASAIKPGFIETNTTATMENGTANAGFTWYEKGYHPAAPDTGLPAAGSVFSSETDPGHGFLMPPNYAGTNAILVDSVCTNSVLTPLAPACYTALSFLTAAAHGPVTNLCVIVHSDGTTETNSFVSPDWLGPSPAALITHGRVSISTKLIDQLTMDAPKLYAVDVPVADKNSPITRIRLSRIGTDTTTHAVFFAVSGTPTTISSPNRPSLSIRFGPNGKLILASTQPGRLESCPGLRGAETLWKNEGAISQALTLTAVPDGPARFYRVVAQ
jgi:hypothetical protein